MSTSTFTRRIAAVGSCVIALLGVSAAHAGLVFNEQAPGTGSSVATAQDTFDPFDRLDAITGTLNTVVPQSGTAAYEVDLYRVFINDYANFSARTVSANPQDDTALFLFDGLGNAVFMNDDDGAGTLSLLPAGNASGPISNGFYYLAIALGGFEAFDASSLGLFLFGGFTDVRAGDPAAGPLSGWVDTFARQAETPYDYRIELTAAGVPEPATAALVLLGLIAARASRAGRRSARSKLAPAQTA